jgi:hypothetical protein
LVVPATTQLLEMQQPLGQVVPLHTQAPPTQSAPAPQSPELPHRQRPLVQAFEVAALHATQAAPPLPQVAKVEVVHWPPAQHPLGQEVPSQTQAPPRQCCPAAQGGPLPQAHWPEASQRLASVLLHAVQALPPMPQFARVCRHEVPLQQPPGQLTASHTQAPATQRRPAPQAGPLPQMHVPEAQPSPVAPQVMHALPEVPQSAPVVATTHAFPLQQPLGQEPELQMHWPPTHA